ncbi:MAG: phosphoribosylformimino-5-aminoimidazole carboxamide ribotide isomerase [Actinomycetota bacterium]|nr:phosphoribosylformimino-5-aminoimidazole carboxamide ribotide isomerase [Actinomycetota bacterium]
MLTRRDSEKSSQGHRLQVIPAVDVLDGAAVRLRQGRFAERFLDAGDPLALIGRYAEAGAQRIHVVDLGAARSGVVDPGFLSEVGAAAAPALVQVGGGIRTIDDAEAAIGAGVDRVVVGTAVISDDGLLGSFAAAFGDRLVVALDVRGGEVASHAWTRGTGRDPVELVKVCAELGVTRVLCTAIERDGMRSGPDLDLLRRVNEASTVEVIASGGVGSQDDLTALGALGVEACVVGRALIDGSLPLTVIS